MLEPAAKRLGLHPFPHPDAAELASLQRPRRLHALPLVRGICMRGERQVRHAKHGDPASASLPAIANCGPSALRKKLLTDERGRVTGVAYFDAQGRLQEQTSDLVVVSCSAVESPRLLLNSKSRMFPNGLGNRYDWVGRNLQGHSYTGASGLFEQDDLRRSRARRIDRDLRLQPWQSRALSPGGLLANEFLRLAVSGCECCSRSGDSALGLSPQRLHAPLFQAEHDGHGTHAGDAGV